MKINLHPGQSKAWDSRKRFIFIIAGTQSGKTSFEPIWLAREIKERGEGDYLAVTATYDLFKLKFLPELLSYFRDVFHWEYSKSEKVIYHEYKPRMFTRIICRSADADGGLESASAKGALFDECGQDRVRLGAWDAIQRRLSLHQGRCLGGTTPYNLGWLKTEVYDKWRKGDPELAVIQFKSIMNPSFPVAEYERHRASDPAWKFEMFYNGNFSRPAGLIYEDWTDDLIVPAFNIPMAWPRFLGVDFGALNTAKIYLTQDPESTIYYIYRESLDGNKSTEEHVKDVRSHNERNLIGWGGAKSEVQQRMDWARAGFALKEPNVSDVEVGINRVIGLLKTKRLYCFDTCKGVLDERGIYARELDESGQPTEKIKDKATFHRLDALRYVVNGVTNFSFSPTSQPDQAGRFGRIVSDSPSMDDEGEEEETEVTVSKSRWKKY